MCLTFRNYQDSLGRDLNAGDYFVWLLIPCVSMCMVSMCVCLSVFVASMVSASNSAALL